MTSKAPSKSAPSPGGKKAAPGEGVAASKNKKPASYVQQAKTVRAINTARSIPGKVFPQWLRTTLAVFVWLGSVPIYISVIAPYVAYNSAMVMTMGLAIFAGMAPHLWPSKTSPWRTVAWAWLVSMVLGMTALTMDWGRYALTIATIVGFTIVAARANKNARRLVDLVQTWRTMR